LFAFSTGITPCPDNVMILTSGLNYGVRQSLPHLAGLVPGLPLMAINPGSGVGVVLSRNPRIQEFIRIGGVVYLLYLGWRIATAVPAGLEAKSSKPFKPVSGRLSTTRRR